MFNYNEEYRIVSTSIAPIYSSPSFSSDLINQALFWEGLIVLDKKEKWIKIKQRDGYVGWMHTFYTTDSEAYEKNPMLRNYDNWYFIKNRYSEILLKDNNRLLLSFGTILPCLINENKYIVILPNNQKVNIDGNSIINITKNVRLDDVILYAKSLLGVPYLWGGRSSFGIDCSGLVQTLLFFLKIHFPRDTKDQISFNNMIQIKSNFEKGDIIFFSKNTIINHVVIFINKSEYVHSSGSVRLNSISANNDNYDNHLFNLIDSVYRINFNE